MMLKRLKVYFLSFSIAVSPIFIIQNANASTLAGGSGWRVVSTVANGIGVTVNGAKDVLINGAKKTVTGVANVTPTAAQVGKFIGRNTAAAAVVGAVDLLLDGVDWVIDEGGKVNKRPVQDYDAGPVDQSDPTLEFVYKSPYYFTNSAYGSKDSLCKAQGSSHASASGLNVTFKNVRSDGAACIYDSENGQFELPVLTVRNPAYDPSAPLPETVPINDKEGKPLTLTSLGEMVIDQAETEVKTGNPAVPIATPVTQAAAAAVVGEAATDETQARPITSELDKSAAIPTDQTAVGEIAPPTTNPDTGEVKSGSISLDFPVFCSWAPSMCVLADKVQEAIVDARDYLKEEPISEASTEVEFEEPKDPEPQKEYFRWGGQCPFSKDSETIKLNDESTEVDYDLTSWCDMATEVKPFVLGAGAIASLMIVSGTGMGRGED